MINPMLEKLRKLIAHEQSARSIGNIAEAEAFAGRIQELLTAHKLSMSEVDFQAREDGEPIDWERVDVRTDVKGSNRANLYWRVMIARAIADVNSCMVVNQTRSRGTAFFFVGRTSDRELAKMLYLYLIDLGEELSAKDAKKNREIQQLKFNVQHDIMDYDLPPWAAPAFRSWMKQYTESWKTGFGEAVAKRLKDRYEEMLKASAQTSANAIIHIKKDTLAVREFLQGKIRNSRSRMQKENGSTDGYAHGQNMGKAVNLSPLRFKSPAERAGRLLGA